MTSFYEMKSSDTGQLVVINQLYVQHVAAAAGDNAIITMTDGAIIKVCLSVDKVSSWFAAKEYRTPCPPPPPPTDKYNVGRRY